MNLMRQAKTRSKQKLNIQTCDNCGLTVETEVDLRKLIAEMIHNSLCGSTSVSAFR